MRSLRYVVIAALGLFVLPLSPLWAATVPDSATRVHVDEKTLIKGYTVTHRNEDVKVAVMPDQVDQPVRVVIKNVNVDALPELPAGMRLVSDAFSYDIIGDEFNPIIVNKPSNVAVRYESTNENPKYVYNWDGAKRQWNRMPTSYDRANHYARGSTVMPYSILVVLEQPTIRASWYDLGGQREGAASNDFPMGTRLRVTNAANGRSVELTVKSTGPFDPRYQIDLTKDMFAAIADIRTGAIDVSVDVLAGASGQMFGDEPAIQSTTAVVMNADTGTVLWGDDRHDVRPLASLTKLMTALVVLDPTRCPDQTCLNREVTIQASDQVGGSTIPLLNGDRVTVRDLLYATLMRSANNAAKALARSTGLSNADFAQAMNAKAAALGLTKTTLVEPTGLDPRNVSTAYEAALMSKEALRTQLMLLATTSQNYSIRTINGRNISFQNTNSLIMNGSPLRIIGSKTGYLDEAGYNLMLKVRSQQMINGKFQQVMVIVLGGPTSTIRFREAEGLAAWGLSHYR